MTDALVLLPNIEALVTAFYRVQPEVIAIVPVRDVVTEFRKEQDWPAVRIRQFNDAPTDGTRLRHSRFDLQVECFGGPKALARLLAETCRAAAVDRLDGRQTFGNVDALVTKCTVGGLRDLPDNEFTPAKPRWLFTLAVHARAPRTN